MNCGFQEIITDQWEKNWFSLTWSKEISDPSIDFDSIGGSVIQQLQKFQQYHPSKENGLS